MCIMKSYMYNNIYLFKAFKKSHLKHNYVINLTKNNKLPVLKNIIRIFNMHIFQGMTNFHNDLICVNNC